MCSLLLIFLLFLVHCECQPKTEITDICQDIVDWDVANNEKMAKVTYEYFDARFEDAINPGGNKKKYEEKENEYNTYAEISQSEANTYLGHINDIAKCANETLMKVLDFYKTEPYKFLSGEESKLLESEQRKVGKFFQKGFGIDMKQRDYKKLWSGWKQSHDKASAELKEPFRIIVNLTTIEAQSNGYKDIADEWLMDEFDDNSMEGNMDQLLRDMFPLFTRVHAYVRHKMFNFYKEKVASESEEITKVFNHPRNPIPVHILGDLSAELWTGVGDIVKPFPEVESIDLTDILIKKDFNPIKLMKLAESFFTSMGLEEMTDTFWEKSRFVKEGKMDCSPAAYDLKKKGDYRITMCTQMNDQSYYIAHHEMGHIVNYMLFSDQPLMYKDVVSASFSEAFGDMIVLSARSRKHLEAIEFLEKSTVQNDDIIKKQRINDLMQKALFQVAILPNTYIIDKWRFAVFRGEITADEYNKKWWEMRMKYSGISSPIERPDDGFDIGSKYHVPSLVPVIRYFYSFIGQFEFHEALCKVAGQTTDFDNCDIYNSKEAGNKLREFLSPGLKEPWRESLKKLTGFDHFRSKPLVDYFKILDDWLIEYLETNNIAIGWEGMWDMS